MCDKIRVTGEMCREVGVVAQKTGTFLLPLLPGLIFSRVPSDSIPRFVRPSVGRLVGRLVGWSPFYFFYLFYSYQVILSQLSDFESN